MLKSSLLSHVRCVSARTNNLVVMSVRHTSVRRTPANEQLHFRDPLAQFTSPKHRCVVSRRSHQSDILTLSVASLSKDSIFPSKGVCSDGLGTLIQTAYVK